MVPQPGIGNSCAGRGRLRDVGSRLPEAAVNLSALSWTWLAKCAFSVSERLRLFCQKPDAECDA